MSVVRGGADDRAAGVDRADDVALVGLDRHAAEGPLGGGPDVAGGDGGLLGAVMVEAADGDLHGGPLSRCVYWQSSTLWRACRTSCSGDLRALGGSSRSPGSGR